MKKRSLCWVAASGALACGAATAPPPASSSTLPEAETALSRGRQAADRGDSVRAEHYLSRSISLGQPEADVIVDLVRACVRGRRLRSAIRHAAPYVRRHPEAVDLRYLVATLHLAVGDPRAAEAELAGVLGVAPEHSGAHFLLGTLQHGRAPEEARRHFDRYLALEPEGAHAAEARAGAADTARAEGSVLLGAPEEAPR